MATQSQRNLSISSVAEAKNDKTIERQCHLSIILQGCALAAPGRLWRPTFVLDSLDFKDLAQPRVVEPVVLLMTTTYLVQIKVFLLQSRNLFLCHKKVV